MKKVVSFLFFIIAIQISYAQNSINLSLFSSGFTSPLGVENCGDSRLFIVQKTGQIIICDSLGNKATTPYLNISDRILSTGSEQGLLGFAFHPNYRINGFFYVNYINKSGNTQVSRFTVSKTDRNIANSSSEKLMLQIQQPYANHNGGCMRFGPDGFLYIAVGDGGSGGDPQNNAQNPAALLGKILRINVNTTEPYSVPPNNPFVNTAGYRSEIWALGVRNPWRFSFDALTGSLIIADVGQDGWEEVNLQFRQSKGGENYGWRCYEGNHPYNTSGCQPMNSYKSPVYEYPHSDVTGDCSITGGFVYRGKKYPSLNGNYFFADYCSGIIRTLTLSNGVVTKKDVFAGDQFAYTSFGEDRNHELYVTSYATGGVYRIVPASAVTSTTGKAVSSLAVYPNPAHETFSVKYSTNNAEECVVNVYSANGRQVYTAKKISAAGDNTWNIKLPQFVKGNCYITVTTVAGITIRQSLVIQ